MSQSNSMSATMIDFGASMSPGLFVTVAILFPLVYFGIGTLVLAISLGNPVNWPLFLKRAVAGSGEYNTSPIGNTAWHGHSRPERLSTLKSARRYQIIDEEAVNGTVTTYRIISPQDKGVNSKLRKAGGSLLVFLTGFLMISLWPLAVLYGLIWWSIYEIWACHYIYLSTRRAKFLAQAHVQDWNQRQWPIYEGNPDFVTIMTEVSVTSVPADSMPTPVRKGPPPLNRGDETYRANITSGEVGDIFRLYQQSGKLSRKIKTILEYESAMPTPVWSKAAMLHAERKRRDKLNAGLYDLTSQESVSIQDLPESPEILDTGLHEIHTVIEAMIPVRQSSVHQNGRRLRRQGRLDLWQPRSNEDIELRGMLSSRTATSAKITLSSVPERRRLAQKTMPAPCRPPTPDRASSIRGARRLFTIDERDGVEEHLSEECLDSRVPQQVSSPVAGVGPDQRR